MTHGRWAHAARVAWLLVLAALLARVVIANRDAVAQLVHVEHPTLLGVTLLAAFCQLGLSASFWTRALSAVGHRVPWRTVAEITARSVPARYVPGSVWYAMSRAAMLRTAGVGVGRLAVTAMLEAVLTVIVSLALGGALLASAGRLPGQEVTGVAWVLVLAVCATPPVLNRVLAWLARHRGTTAPRLAWRDLGVLVAWMTAFWAVSALAFTCYLLAFDVTLPPSIVIAGAFLVAWSVGFLTPIAPQGAGAFEVVVVALLVGTAGGPLTVVVVGFRVLIGVRDAVAFAWASWRGRTGRSQPGVLSSATRTRYRWRHPQDRSSTRTSPSRR